MIQKLKILPIKLKYLKTQKLTKELNKYIILKKNKVLTLKSKNYSEF